jgi:RES domain-containing protein
LTRAVVQRVAAAPRSTVIGHFERHVSMNRRQLTASTAGGRWGLPGSYVVLYLGRPRASVTVEAYRHLVDPFAEQGMTGAMIAPRRLLVCELSVSEVLDLRSKDARLQVGLTERDFMSEIGDYAACQAVGQAAHQLELHGILAPAATGLGETLALFEQHLPADEFPRLVAEETWDGLPDDPRHLRIVRGAEETA